MSPAFLIAAAAGAAVPLVLHMMQSNRTVKTPFPTVRFLKMAEKKSSRRAHMEHFLLWLLRTVIMILLGLAFAMPMLRTRRLAWLGEAPRDVAIILDASYSMEYNTGRQTVWTKATDTAAAIINGLGENDHFCIYAARMQPEPIIAEPIGDKEQGLGQLKGIQTSHASSQLAPTLTAVLDVLQEKAAGREREIYILTDNQALPWDSFGRMEKAMAAGDAPADSASAPDAPPPSGVAPSSWDASRIDKKTTVFVTLLGVSSPENVSPVEAELRPPLLLKGASASVTARLSHSGTARDTAVTLFVNGKETGHRSTVAGTRQGGQVTFTIPPLAPGTHAAYLQTPDDNLPLDNAFHFLLRVKDELPTLCVGSERDTFFLRMALKATGGEGSTVSAKWTPPGSLDGEELHQYACVFLCNALPMPGQAITAIEQYVKSGGLVVLFPGADALPSDYTAWQCLPGFPTGVRDLGLAERKRMLSWDKPEHPVLRTLRAAAAAPVVTIRQNLAWETLDERAVRLVSSGSGHPFLLDRPHGRGHVLMFAVAADRSWSDFPLSPFYLPFVMQIIEYGAGVGSFTPYIWSTDSLPLEEYLPEATHNSTLTNPEGRPVPTRTAIVNGRTVVHAEDLMLPGVYTLNTPGTPGDGPALAVNIPRAESNLAPLSPGDIPELIGAKDLYLAESKEHLLRLIDEHRIGRTFGEHLLWLALILAIVEFFYANFLLRSRPPLTSRLGIEPSGRLLGHVLSLGRGKKEGQAA